jgi:hypothetical protein
MATHQVMAIRWSCAKWWRAVANVGGDEVAYASNYGTRWHTLAGYNKPCLYAKVFYTLVLTMW